MKIYKKKLLPSALDQGHGARQQAEAVVLTGHPGRTITDYAGKIGADCIIAGSHKPGMKDFSWVTVIIP